MVLGTNLSRSKHSQLSLKGQRLSFQNSCPSKGARVKIPTPLLLILTLMPGYGKFNIHKYTCQPTPLTNLGVQARATTPPLFTRGRRMRVMEKKAIVDGNVLFKGHSTR